MKKTITFTSRNGDDFVLQPDKTICVQCRQESYQAHGFKLNEFSDGINSVIKTTSFTVHICDNCDAHYLHLFAVNNREFMDVFPSDVMDGLKNYLVRISDGLIAKELRKMNYSVDQAQPT
jgi:hypothetical protein